MPDNQAGSTCVSTSIGHTLSIPLKYFGLGFKLRRDLMAAHEPRSSGGRGDLRQEIGPGIDDVGLDCCKEELRSVLKED